MNAVNANTITKTHKTKSKKKVKSKTAESRLQAHVQLEMAKRKHQISQRKSVMRLRRMRKITRSQNSGGGRPHYPAQRRLWFILESGKLAGDE